MRRAFVSFFVVLWLATAAVSAAEPPALAKARMLYNSGDYEAAIASAEEVRTPDWRDAAQLIVARSHLERYRRTSNDMDLLAARAALADVRSEALMPRDHVDLLIGLGQSLFSSGDFGAAAELFDNALAQSFLLGRRDRLQLLDWWGNAMDRAAQGRPVERRTQLFTRVVERMEDELKRDAENAMANYWLAAGARGAGDVERAWDAAVAGWVRSRLVPEGADTLRSDLDRLMTQGIIPERARLRKEPSDAAKVMREQWDAIKEQWK